MIGRLLRTAKTVACDSRIPRWTRVLLVIGLLPIPGPIDEAVLLAALAGVCIRHRDIVRESWGKS